MIIGCVLQYLKRFDVSSTGKQSLFSAMTIPTATIARPCLATPEKSLSPLLVIISSMYVPICNRFHIIRANNGKITSF